MKSENHHDSSVIAHRTYPSLSDQFGRETHALKHKLPLSSRAPLTDARFGIGRLRVVVAIATILIIIALMVLG
jgi:hypothetical protein